MTDWDAHIDLFYGSPAFDTSDPAGTVERMRRLLAVEHVDGPLAAFELAGVHDSLGMGREAATLYREALGGGLDAEVAGRARLQLASTLRADGDYAAAIDLLREPVDEAHEGARAAFLALALHDAGRGAEALRTAIEALVPTLPRYRRSVAAYAAALAD
ncbi:tetratricopeptide repeat protein [Demequina sp.]|uniref:tetratricopeptide repeat protein n=1 Tax=Demequina sp. TaxID=2050685 RepID=UPI0025CD8393|nr:tetratricopeptide repeat protein [Demequina sp.]